MLVLFYKNNIVSFKETFFLYLCYIIVYENGGNIYENKYFRINEYNSG